MEKHPSNLAWITKNAPEKRARKPQGLSGFVLLRAVVLFHGTFPNFREEAWRPTCRARAMGCHVAFAIAGPKYGMLKTTRASGSNAKQYERLSVQYMVSSEVSPPGETQRLLHPISSSSAAEQPGAKTSFGRRKTHGSEGKAFEQRPRAFIASGSFSGWNYLLTCCS